MKDPRTAEIEWLVNPPAFHGWHALLRLLCASYAYMNDRIDPPSSLRSWNTDTLEEKARGENLVLALASGRPVACAFGKPRDDVLYVGKVAVDERFRRRGLARGLIERLEQIACSLGLSQLELDVRMELVANQRTFDALGFRVVDHRAHPGYDRPTEVIMRKEL